VIEGRILVEIGELTKIVPPETKLKPGCPFAHEQPKPALENELGGIGQTLGENMTNAKGVHKSPPPASSGAANYTDGDEEPDPRQPPRKLAGIEIVVAKEKVKLDNGRVLVYPLTCAAHHLVPAQESLKDSPILKFMCKAGEPQDFRKSGKPARKPVAGSLVWGNVGYNVNGSQNGVWLPGNYAVGAGKGGVAVWTSRKQARKSMSDKQALENWAKLDLSAAEWKQLSKDPQEEERPQTPGSRAAALKGATDRKFMLAGKNYNIHPDNPKWAYVKEAMDKAGGQFHDRHGDYSKEVAKYLKKVAGAYQQKYDAAMGLTKEKECTDCENAVRPAKAKKSQLGPPYGIVARLVDCSTFYKQFVQTQELTAGNIFTSKWVSSWIKKKKPGWKSKSK
jgi:hypothetical protein